MKIFKMESGKLAKWLAVIFVGAAIISGLALLVSGLPGAIRNREPWPRVKYDPGKDLSFDASQGFPGVREVTADFAFEAVYVRASPDDEFHVRYAGTARNIDDWKTVFTMELRDDVLVLDSHWRGILPLGSVTAEILVPVGFSGILKVESGSGRLNVEGIVADSCIFRLGSGSLDVRDIKADELTLRNSSGSIDLENLDARNIVIRAVSGSIRGGGISADNTEVKNSSGRTVLDRVSGSMVLEGSSGSADVVFSEPGSLIDFHLSSGGIDVTLPAGSEFNLDASTSSGRITSDFAVSVHGDLARNKLRGDVGSPGGREVKLRTASGSISLMDS